MIQKLYNAMIHQLATNQSNQPNQSNQSKQSKHDSKLYKISTGSVVEQLHSK
jgi:hypothetical protein